MRLILGLIKGVIIGGGLGFGFSQLGSLAQAGFMQWVLYAAIGALVGFIGGKPFWRHETIWTPVVKALFGAAIAIGLFALVTKVLGGASIKLSFLGPEVTAVTPWILGSVIGAVYGMFVEIDDGGKADAAGGGKPAAKD